ncbi:MAG TPA: PSD1 and planctomycete cytochrome C domain-containing protein [Pirellulaceae bacterium]|nr:PSD1 and planctomycete cytochrome C domain-containing protein [Pirellulaceae bacterium]HMO92106.1 PSD1 and planctomycete cytochrome C domain-containing protein [Pirellulaceae bacterium]HMP69306.1 PSD1 and planctomycete cytochrome C domain-containing protein [Pirellulaceae bacterium]
MNLRLQFVPQRRHLFVSPHRGFGLNSVVLQVCVWVLIFLGRAQGQDSTDPTSNTAQGQQKPNATRIDFSAEVKPILLKGCFPCHGPDEETREGGLALHERATALSELDSGEIGIVPGDPENSEVYRRLVATNRSERMPPAASHVDQLTAEEIETIRRWIVEGAEYTAHWSFRPLRSPEVPRVADSGWQRNPIDAFVWQRLEQVGLTPAPEASREILLRRLSLDLIGLPATLQEIDEYVNDESDDAYEKVVERLLNSPRFGEHWARHWLDLARYADSQGYAQDELRTIWPYRDWVIRAINDDMPFDQFTIEQLAGDLLENPTHEQLVATGFHRNTMTNTEGGTDDEEFRHAAVVDRVNTTAQVWLGLTVGCAQCHTHKYDPITHHNYYELFAIFNQTTDNDQPDNSPTINYIDVHQRAALRTLNQRISTLLEADGRTDVPDIDHQVAEIEQIKRSIAEIQVHRTPVMQEFDGDRRRKTHVAIRGSFRSPGEEVEAKFPAFFGEFADLSLVGELPREVAAHEITDSGKKPATNATQESIGSTTNRLELARFLVSNENSLTARVEANRIWTNFFGQGLVPTAEDFGSQGIPPEHPELLDWLAVSLIEGGWSRKDVCRLIVNSATYRQASVLSDAKLEIDPNNRLLSRGSRYRLSAEQLRDYALAVSGLLSEKMYGPPVRPPQPKLGLAAAFGGSLDWDPSTGEDRYRRGIYTLWRRTFPYPAFDALDAPDRRVCNVNRTRTNTPIGAFVTLNDPVFIELAVATAMQITSNNQGGDFGTAIEFTFRTIVGRIPDERERQIVGELLAKQVANFSGRLEAAKQLISVFEPARGLSDLESVDVAAWTVVANSLLNLDEVLTRN